MDIELTPSGTHPHITVVRVSGFVDGSNYNELIDAVAEAYEQGARAFLLDLAGVDYVSTAGILALQTITKIAHGDYDPEQGWQSVATFRQAREVEGKEKTVRLLNPQNSLLRTLEIVKLREHFHVYADETYALEAFEMVS